MARTINTAQVAALKIKGQTLSHSLGGKGGSLLARRLSKTTSWVYQYRHDEKQKRYAFGHYSRDGSAVDGEGAYTLKEAINKARELSALQEAVGDLSEHFKEQQASAAETRHEAEQARHARQQEARDYSLANLCTAYWKHLEADGKPSARDVRNGLRLWVIERHPALAARKASDITTDDVLCILRAIIDAGHTTTTNRVRSYLSAAYSFGLGSSTDPLASSRASGFRLTTNPVAPVKPVKSFEKAGQRHLSRDEMGELLRRLEAVDNGPSRAVVLSLRLGGQRPTQLLAATQSDYDADRGILTLKDNKGRRTHARLHILPVVESVASLLAQALDNPHPLRPGLYHGLTMETVSKQVRAISRDMEELGIEPFGWRDLRRTCETMLADMGISRDIRAQIQSHGLSGIQDRHYDRHDYIEQKRQALTAWNKRLDELKTGTEQAGNVVNLR